LNVPPSADRRRRVRDHYDELSSYYAELWGEHIHHGYYARGDESREEATRGLIDRLVGDMRLPRGAAVLDVGCGIGGTARLLSRQYGCRVTGVTLSFVQACMARERDGAREASRFIVGDAAALPFAGAFDGVLAVEVLSHLENRDAFFAQTARLLRRDGRIGIAAWLKSSDLRGSRERRIVAPIEEGMLVTLPTKEQYEQLLAGAGFRLDSYRDISSEVARTWDLCLELVTKPALWSLAVQKGSDTLAFVKSFRAMQAGFSDGAFRYALIAAIKS
jgi:tocopherol O-methyltransferase